MKNKKIILGILIVSFIIVVIICTVLFFVEPIFAWVIVFFASVFYGGLALGLMKNRKILLLPDLTIKATIIAKNVIKKRERQGRIYVTNTYYQITFETENHMQWTFDFSLELFNSFLKGDSGNLVYKVSKWQRIYYVGFFRT